MNRSRWSRVGSGMGILLPVGMLLLLVAGCGSSQKEMMAKDQLASAQKAYAEAKANPNVEAYAPLLLLDAGKSVQAAEGATGTDDILHLGYIAERKTRIAVAVAEGKLAEKDIEKLNLETAEIVGQKRAQEAKVALRDAERARSEAERARMEAGKALTEAEKARLDARAEAEKAARAKAEADQLMRELSELKAQQTERGIVLTIGDVLFATGKATLSESANRSVDKLSEFLKKYPERKVLIEGHTDSVGSDEFNLTLSQKRADSAKEKLVADGVDDGRITTTGYGKQYPMASNETAAGRQLNRRVEVIILNEGVLPETQMRK